MLILRRKPNESLLIGEDIRITILECGSGSVKLAIAAPKHCSILREELSEAALNNLEALSPNFEAVQSLTNFLHPWEEIGQPKEEDTQ